MKFTRSRRAAVGVVGAGLLALSMVACGSQKSSSPTTGVTPSTSVDSALAAMVPASVKSDGKILIGSDSTYAPSEFLDTDGKTIIGFDVDLFNAVAAKLGLKTEWQSADFGTLITSVQSGKYEIGVSSFTVNADREKQANMISYFSAGTQWAQKTGGSVDPNNACGQNVAVQKSTVQVDDITARSKKCTDAGKKAITIDQYQKQDDATAAVVSGKDVAMLADSPVCAYAVKQSNGQLALLGDIYDSAPYGYVVNKDADGLAFANAIKGAVMALINDGTYNKILTTWGVQAGAIPASAVAVNPTTS
jgi:polar amino acid transport system substrate-binding protein